MHESSRISPAEPVIVAEHLFKRFDATQALDDVSLTLYPGELHAVVGENGAGKSTLVKILSGIHQPDSGRVLVKGFEESFQNPREAMGAGFVVIPQELSLVPAFTVAENVMLGHLPMRRALGLLPVVDRGKLREGARAALARLGFVPDLDRQVDRLPYALQQLVAIAKALSREAAVLLLDEPTAALEQREARRLFDTITALKAQGVAIIYVSHRLEEVVELADRCMVLRDGRVVATARRGEFDAERLIRLMTGRDIAGARASEARGVGEALIDMALPGPAGTPSNVRSLTLRARLLYRRLLASSNL